ncbi:MAG: energy transducer TonB [Betaproteobacteria bacterium]
MSEFTPEPEPGESPSAAGRLALALAASLALHLALILGVQVRMAQQSGKLPPAMEVRVERHAGRASVPVQSTPEPVAAPAVNAAAEPVPDEKAAQPGSAMPAPPVAEPVSPLLPTLEIPLIEDPTYYPAKQLDVPPAAQGPIKPAYPDKAAAQGLEGHVVLLLLIDEAGTVKEATVAEASPEGVFEESALAAFRSARFAPAQKNGRAVKSRVLIRVTYELKDRDKPIFLQPPLPVVP